MDTPVALGGNMVFHRDLFIRVGFDPGITRGEDIDYLINARLAGHRFWLDKELLITHLPPEAYGALPYAKLVQDVYRFVYKREKLRLAGTDPAQFDPYPGRFLRDDVEEQALAALQAAVTPEAAVRFGPPDWLCLHPPIIQRSFVCPWSRPIPYRRSPAHIGDSDPRA